MSGVVLVSESGAGTQAPAPERTTHRSYHVLLTTINIVCGAVLMNGAGAVARLMGLERAARVGSDMGLQTAGVPAGRIRSFHHQPTVTASQGNDESLSWFINSIRKQKDS